MPPGLDTSITWATGRLMRRGVASGEQEFTRILKDRTSLEEQTAIYKAWVSACQRARLKALESNNAAKAQEYAEAEKRVLQQAAEQVGSNACEKLSQDPDAAMAATTESTPHQVQVGATQTREAENAQREQPAATAATSTGSARPLTQLDSSQLRTHTKVAHSAQKQLQGSTLDSVQSQQLVPSSDATKLQVLASTQTMSAILQKLSSRTHSAQGHLQASTADSYQLQVQTAGSDSTYRQALQQATPTGTAQRQLQATPADSAPRQQPHATATDSAPRHPPAAAAAAPERPQRKPLASIIAQEHQQLHALAPETAKHHSDAKMEPAQHPSSAILEPAQHPSGAINGAGVSDSGPLVPHQGPAVPTESAQQHVHTETAGVKEGEYHRAQAAASDSMHRQPPQHQPQQQAQPAHSTHSAQRQAHSQPLQHQHTGQGASTRPLPKQPSISSYKESCFSGWDIADPNLVRPDNYRPIKSPKEGDILFVRGAPFKIMYRIGSGASSKVYKVLGPNLRLFALKVVTLKGNSKEMVRGFQQEFDKLRSLKDAPGVINVHAIEEFPEDKMLLMCLELGEIDLAHLMKKKRQEWAARGITDPFLADPTFICGLWHDMLRAVQSVHEHKMVHADLKPANLVIVNGSIKIIDFGISMKCSANTTAIHRTDNTGTVNYMSPEAISNNERVGRNSDVWSLGCILYEIAYGRLPFGHITNLASKVEAIMNGKIAFPAISQGDVLDVLKRCLVRNPDKRADINELLNHQYLKSVAGGVVTHQALFNMLTAYSRRLGISEQEVNEHCRELQQAWNCGENLSAETICKRALREKQSVPIPHLQPPQEPKHEDTYDKYDKYKADRTILQEQQPNIQAGHDMAALAPKSSHIESTLNTQQCESATAYPVSGVRGSGEAPPLHQPQMKLPRVDPARDKLEARLFAIRQAHDQNDDGDTRTRL